MPQPETRFSKKWILLAVAGLALVAVAVWVVFQPAAPAFKEAEPVPPSAAEPVADEESSLQSAGHDANIAAMLHIVQGVTGTEPEIRRRISELLESKDPLQQAGGLALSAGQGTLEASTDVSGCSPQVLLGAMDLTGNLFGNDPRNALLGRWENSMGGAQTAGEKAHRLLIESRLPYGGGSTALELMQNVNDPQAISAGLREFALNEELPLSIRAESLLLLRNHLENKAYQEFVHICVQEAAQWEAGSAWENRLARLREWADAIPAGAPLMVDSGFVAKTFSSSYPGLVEDVECLLRYGLQGGWVQLDASAATPLRESIAKLDETILTGPDLSALHRLRREMGTWLAGE